LIAGGLWLFVPRGLRGSGLGFFGVSFVVVSSAWLRLSAGIAVQRLVSLNESSARHRENDLA